MLPPPHIEGTWWSSHRFVAGQNASYEARLFSSPLGCAGNNYVVNSIAQTNVFRCGEPEFGDLPGARIWPGREIRVDRVAWEVWSSDPEAAVRVWRSSVWEVETAGTWVQPGAPLPVFDTPLPSSGAERVADLERVVAELLNARAHGHLYGMRSYAPAVVLPDPFAIKLCTWPSPDGAYTREGWSPAADVHVRFTLFEAHG